MKTRKKWRPGGRQRQSAAYHRKAVHERKRVIRLRVNGHFKAIKYDCLRRYKKSG